jgi:phosphoribosylamine--glycine ligase
VKILLLGSGAREHALAWKLKKSPLLTQLVAAPGNPGIASLAECRKVDLSSSDAVVALARDCASNLVVVGPEAPLVAGVADALRQAGFEVFGPDAAAARIEGSKAFAKEVMAAAGVPTARFELFDDAEKAAQRALEWGAVVVKADGLAAGKGVVVATSGAEAAEACRSLGRLPAGRSILLEELLVGPELSVIALCDGERFVLLPAAQDHKRLFDADEGPNTGGMGAYAPANLLSPEGLEDVGRRVIAPTLRELSARGSPFRGALYAGLMLTAEGPKVIEFNCRLGDPETQAIMIQLADDLVPYLVQCARGHLEASRNPAILGGVTVAVVLAAAGYPEAPRTGDRITGLDAALPSDAVIFHAGTRLEAGNFVTAGGRVLTVSARGASVDEARRAAYVAAENVRFDGRQLRHDIGIKAPS